MVLENYRGRLGFGLIADSHMLGYACFRLPIRSRVSALSSSLTHSPCSYSHSYSYKSIQRHSAATSSLVLLPRSVFQRDGAHSSIEGCCHLSNLRRTQHHSSTCLLAAGNANGCVGASIWHALLPSCHFSDTQKRMPLRVCNGTGIGSCFPEVRSSVGIYGKCDSVNCARFSSVGGGGFSEGSWNATWDVRPARWLHGSHSAWLLFGVCACFANLNPIQAEAEGPAVVDEGNDGGLDEEEGDAILAETDKASHGKKIYTDYSITGIPGDGRCLFRAVAHGACLRKGKPSPNESLQRELADELRARVADELIKRRDESEWFIEGEFDTYVEQIRKPHVWGGEPELIMASHVLQMPITVYIHDRNSDGLIAIAEYGQDYGKGNPVRVLFRGYGHYDALQIHDD
uniref:Ubiquitin thioesterase OTU n=1 Tax=Wollemia nobilis TaxID=56998 RepID=A0A0C9QKZ0_9CONI